jgi:serine/threonine protein kinase
VSTTEVGRRPSSGKPDSSNRDGVSLEAVIGSDRRLDELSCARLLGNVAELVHAAQKAGQPLGTVTPAAILVLPDGSAKLTTGPASLGYAAPERLRGSAGDRRTDVFALGVVLWEVLAHERLFDGSDDDAIKRAVLERAIRPPSELNANVPVELDAICKRALARDPSDRYQSAHVMAAEIDAVLGDAGYPDSNEQIAAYVARAFATAEPATGERAAAPTSRSAGTLPPPVLKQAARSTSTESGPIAAPPTTVLGAAPSSTAKPPPFAPEVAENPLPGNAPSSTTRPPAITPAAPTRTVTGAPSSTTRPPASTPAAPTRTVTGGAPSSTTKPPPFPPSAAPATTLSGAGGAPPSATQPPPVPPVVPASSPGSGPIATTGAPGTLPAFSAQPRPPAQTALLGSPGAPLPSTTAPFGSQAIEPSSKPVALPASAPPKFTKTEILGSLAPPPLPASAAGPHPLPTSAAGPHPALPHARMEAPPMQAQIAIEAKVLAPPGPTAHPQPPKSIANAETLATPALPAQPAQLVAPPASPQPGSSPASRQSTDDGGAFGPEHHTDPAEVVALPQGDANAASGVREGRDVLAGWGWSTGSVQALDDDEAEDALRRGRRNLVIAIAGALGVVMIIAIAAFAFSGSKKPDEQDSHGAVAPPSPTPISATAPETPTAPAPAQPTDPTPTPTTAEPARTEPPAPSTAPASTDPARPESPPPPPAAPPGPGAVVPPRFDSAKPEPAPVEPPKAESPRAEPRNAEPPKPEPAKPEPAKVEPPKVTAAPKPAPRAEPPKPEPARAIEKKPPEPKKPPDKAAKHPPAPERIAKANTRAQPVDPYAAEPRRADPAAAYRTGLQQYAHGDTAGALATFRGSLQINPGFAPTWRGIGLVYEKMGNKGQARAAFKRYLQLAPTAGDADQIRDRMERLGS